MLAYPTDRMLGGEEPGRSSPGSSLRALAVPSKRVSEPGGDIGVREERASEPMRESVELPVATPAAHARLIWSGKVPWTRTTVHHFRGRRWTTSTRLSAQHGLRSRRPGALGAECIRVLAPRCALGARQAGRLLDFELAKRR
jgi:hypothetical protein